MVKNDNVTKTLYFLISFCIAEKFRISIKQIEKLNLQLLQISKQTKDSEQPDYKKDHNHNI